MGRLEKADFTGKIGNGISKLIKGALVSIKEIRKNDIYITTAEVMRGSNSSISSAKADHIQTGHNRLAHVGIKGIPIDKGAFGNGRVSDLSFGDYCVIGKHHRLLSLREFIKLKSCLIMCIRICGVHLAVPPRVEIGTSYLSLMNTLGKCGFIY